MSQSSPSFLCQAGFPLATNPVRYVYNSDSASPTKLAFDMDYEIYKLASELKENQKLNPDHAIRLATWGNFPNRTPSSESFLSYPSLSNPEKVQEFDETSSMGSLSIEPGPRLFALTRESSGSACRRSLRSFKSFNLIDPKDVLFDENRRGSPSEVAFFSQAREVLDTNGTKFCELPLLTSLPPLKLEKLSSKDSPAEDVREVISRSSSTLAEVNKAMNINSVNLDASSAATDSSCKIPTRESSLRHSYGGSPSYRKRVSIRSETCGIQEARKVSFEHSIDSSTEASQKNIDISTEDEVSRRIKELKDQKRLRDRPLTIPAAEPILTFGSPETNCSISHISLSGARSWRAPDRLYESQSSWVDDVSIPKSFEPSAPSPSVVQRTNKNSSFRVSSVAKKGTAVTHSPLFKQISGPEPQDPVPPKRTNSRILRRLSRPISPPKQEKHKMTFSNPLIDERPKCNNPGDGMINDYILLPKLSQKIKFHQTGRVISFSEVGDSNGYAVFCCVGMGLTRYITAFYDELALTLKLRLITPDRPGIGASDAHEDGLDTPLSWPGRTIFVPAALMYANLFR